MLTFQAYKVMDEVAIIDTLLLTCILDPLRNKRNTTFFEVDIFYRYRPIGSEEVESNLLVSPLRLCHCSNTP